MNVLVNSKSKFLLERKNITNREDMLEIRTCLRGKGLIRPAEKVHQLPLLNDFEFL